MKATEQCCLLWCTRWFYLLSMCIKLKCVTIVIKATEQYFPVVLFIMLYKVVLTLESVDEIWRVSIQSYSEYFMVPGGLFIFLKIKWFYWSMCYSKLWSAAKWKLRIAFCVMFLMLFCLWVKSLRFKKWTDNFPEKPLAYSIKSFTETK